MLIDIILSNDKIAIFKNQKNKIIKLEHKIDNFLHTSTDINIKDIEDIVATYDVYIE